MLRWLTRSTPERAPIDLEVVTAERVERPVAVEGGDPVTALDALVRARRSAGG